MSGSPLSPMSPMSPMSPNSMSRRGSFFNRRGSSFKSKKAEEALAAMQRRVIVYPKVIFNIQIDIPGNHHLFVCVKTIVKGKEIDVGYSETVPSTLDSTVARFTAPFEVTKFSGVDINQRIVVNILDGDSLAIREGYLIASVDFNITELEKAHTVLPINRGQELLGHISFISDYELDAKTVTLENINDISLGFMRSQAPVPDDIRAKHKSFTERFAFYSMDVMCTDGIPFAANLMGSGGIFVRVCVSDGQEPPWSPNLKCLWRSVEIYDPPYSAGAQEIKTSHESFTDSRDLSKPVTDDKYFVVQIFVLGVDGSLDTAPRCCSYACVRLSQFLGGIDAQDGEARTFTRQLVWNHEFYDSLTTKMDEKIASEKDKGTNSKKRSMFSRTREVHKTPQMALDDLLNKVSSAGDSAKIFERISGKQTEDTNSENDWKSNVPEDSDESGDFLFGKVELAITKEIFDVTVGEGDDIYEENIRMLHQISYQKWMEKMKEPFHDACDHQSKSLKSSNKMLEYSLEGWSITPTVLLDMHYPCVQHLMYTFDKERSDVILESTFRGSQVLNCYRTVLDALGSSYLGGEARILAGGGVQPPREEHPSYGYPRNTALPLAQELLLASKKPSGGLLNNNDARDEYLDPDGVLNEVLNNSNPESSWGGKQYVVNSSFSCIENTIQSALEASVLYQPSLIPSSDGDEAGGSQEGREVESESRRSASRKKSRGATRSQSRPNNDASKAVITKVNAAYLGCGYDDIDEKMKAFWDTIPRDLVVDQGLSFNVDLDVMEQLLFQNGGKKKTADHEARCVVWVLGKTLPQEDLERFSKLVERHADSRSKTIWLIFLAAEFRPDLDCTDEETIEIIAEPFGELKHAYNQALQRAALRRLAKVSDVDVTAADLAGVDVRSTRVRLFHYCTWSEVISKAFLMEDEFNIREHSDRGSDRDETRSQCSSSKKSSKVSAEVLLPSVDTIRTILKEEFREISISRIIGRHEFDDGMAELAQKKGKKEKSVQEKEKEREKEEEKEKEKENNENKKNSRGFFGKLLGNNKPSTENENVEEAPKPLEKIRSKRSMIEAMQEKRIQNFVELTNMRIHFDEELKLSMIQRVRDFYCEFLFELEVESRDQKSDDRTQNTEFKCTEQSCANPCPIS